MSGALVSHFRDSIHLWGTSCSDELNRQSTEDVDGEQPASRDDLVARFVMLDPRPAMAQHSRPAIARHLAVAHQSPSSLCESGVVRIRTGRPR